MMSTFYTALACGCTDLISLRPFISQNTLRARRACCNIACFINLGLQRCLFGTDILTHHIIYVAIVDIQIKNTWQCTWVCVFCIKKGRRFRTFSRSFLSVQSCEESFVSSQTLSSKELSVHPKVQHLMKETSRECTEHHCVQNKPPQSQGFQAVHEPSRNTVLKFHPGFPEML